MTEKNVADPALYALLERIASALEERNATARVSAPSDEFSAFVWQSATLDFDPVRSVNRIPLSLLRGIDYQQDKLMENTLRFARGFAANNALLWGARGTGKSSLVKAIHGEVSVANPLVLVEIHREDLATLPQLLSAIGTDRRRFIVFCDDLAFESGESSYKSLKAILEGGIEGRPENVIFYATSNRRHLMARDMIENERSTAINPSEAVEEKVSLSDRFGLWLGFHSIDQDTYLAMINGYADAIGLAKGSARAELEKQSLAWSVSRGSRSGRVAWQFIVDTAGEAGIKITF
ncbi:ATP-binding protein [Alphaproteobacteria bacterium LSUCC0684]